MDTKDKEKQCWLLKRYVIRACFSIAKYYSHFPNILNYVLSFIDCKEQSCNMYY